MFLLNHAAAEFCSPLTPRPAPNFRRRLLLENLEPRCMLTTLILEETFKSPTFTTSGSFEGMTEILSLNFTDEFAGSTTISGQLAYSSAEDGLGDVTISGTGTGADNCWQYEFEFQGSASFEDQAGALSQFNVFVSSFDYLTPVIPACAGSGPLFVDNDLSGTFSTADFGADLTWTTPVMDGQTTGSWNGDIVFDGEPFDIQPTAASFDRTTLEFEFVTTGVPAVSPTPATPVSHVDVFWADGPTAADTMSPPLTQSVPIYWNQAGGRVRVTDLPEPPSTATHLLVIADYNNEVAEHNESNNVWSVGPCWHNVANPRDVDGNGHVIPLDALLLINDLNFHEARYLPCPGPGQEPTVFLDVNGDDWIAPIDVLCVINYLNLVVYNQGASGEAIGHAPLDEPVVLLGLEPDAINVEPVPVAESREWQPMTAAAASDAALLEYLTGEAGSPPEFRDLTAAQSSDQSRCDLFAYDECFWK